MSPTLVRHAKFIQPLASAQILAQILKVAQLKYLAFALTLAEFGNYALVITVGSALHLMLIGPVNSWALRFYAPHLRSGSINRYLSVVYTFVLVSVLLISAVAVLFELTFKLFDPDSVPAIIRVIPIAFIYGLTFAATDTFAAVMTASKSEWRGAVLIAGPGFFTLIALMTIGSINSSYGALITTLLFSSTIGFIGALLVVKSHFSAITQGRFKSYFSLTSVGVLKRDFDYVGPFFIWSITGYLVAFGDRWVLSLYHSVEEVGMYLVMYAVTFGVVNTINGATMRVIEPTAYRISSANNSMASKVTNKIVNRVVFVSVMLMLACGIPYAIWPAQIIAFFSTQDHVIAPNLLWLMFISAVIFNLSQQLVVKGLLAFNPRLYLIPKIVHGVLVIGLMLLLVPPSGIAGAIWSLLIANSMLIALTAMRNRLTFGVKPAR